MPAEYGTTTGTRKRRESGRTRGGRPYKTIGEIQCAPDSLLPPTNFASTRAVTTQALTV